MVQRHAPPAGVLAGVGEDELRALAAVEELDRASRAREDGAAAGEAHVEHEPLVRCHLPILARLDDRRLTGDAEGRLVAAADAHVERVDRKRHPSPWTIRRSSRANSYANCAGHSGWPWTAW